MPKKRRKQRKRKKLVFKSELRKKREITDSLKQAPIKVPSNAPVFKIKVKRK